MPKIDLTYLRGLSDDRLLSVLALVTSGDVATIERDRDLAEAVRRELNARGVSHAL